MTNRPPGAVRILIVPYFAFFVFAETSTGGWTMRNATASRAAKVNLRFTLGIEDIYFPPAPRSAELICLRSFAFEYRRRRPAPAASKPVPNRSSDAGSGVGVGVDEFVGGVGGVELGGFAQLSQSF